MMPPAIQARADTRASQWHGPEAFKATGDLLEAQGYENGYVHLASVGPEKALADPYADVQVIRKVIEQETDKGNDVIVATHSYGGVPGCNACEGYLKKDTDGKPGVLGMIFICVSEPAQSKCSKLRGMIPVFRCSKRHLSLDGLELAAVTVVHHERRHARSWQFGRDLLPGLFRWREGTMAERAAAAFFKVSVCLASGLWRSN